MFCYGDRSWCFSPDCKNECGRQLTEFHRQEAKRKGLLVSGRYFCGDNIRKEQEENKENLSK